MNEIFGLDSALNQAIQQENIAVGNMVISTTLVIEICRRIVELEKEQCKKLTFKKYETLVDINNHNYGRYEALVDGGYIKGGDV